MGTIVPTRLQQIHAVEEEIRGIKSGIGASIEKKN